MWSERTRVGKELSGALVATLAGTLLHQQQKLGSSMAGHGR